MEDLKRKKKYSEERRNRYVLQSEFTLRENVLIVRLKGEIDHHEATKLRKEWQRYLQSKELNHVILNVQEVSFMDSSGIGVVLGRYKEVVSQGGELVLCHVNDQIDRLFNMAGLYKIIRVEETEQQALLS